MELGEEVESCLLKVTLECIFHAHDDDMQREGLKLGAWYLVDKALSTVVNWGTFYVLIMKLKASVKKKGYICKLVT